MRTGSEKVDALARDLARLLNDLTGLHRELARHMRSKFEAIKRADSDQIQSITAREMVLANRAEQREGLRRQITKRILEGLGLDPGQCGTMRVTKLAEHFREPRRSQLLVAAAGLRDKLEEIERMRVTTALISREMLKHMQEVLSVMTSGGRAADVYSRTGRPERAASANIIEVVG